MKINEKGPGSIPVTERKEFQDNRFHCAFLLHSSRFNSIFSVKTDTDSPLDLASGITGSLPYVLFNSKRRNAER